MVAILIQCVYVFADVRYVVSFGNLALFALMYGLTMSKDLINELHLINDNIQAKASETEILKQFSVFVDFHSDVQQLSTYHTYIYYIKYIYESIDKLL